MRREAAKTGRYGKKKRENGELRRLKDGAASLLAAVTILLVLLLSTLLPEDLRSFAEAGLGPRTVIVLDTAEAEPTPDTAVFIRLADVDGDVSPEVIVKLMNVIPAEEGVELTGDEPRILIYHTHDTEAYRQTPGSEYEPSGDYRTEDPERNVYAVGEELRRILLEDYGIIAIHADEKHEKPKLTEAYSRSLLTMLKYREMYPSIEMFIDIHRDGVADTGYEDDFVTVGGLECARMMFVVGTGSSGRSSQYAPEPTGEEELAMPDFESNYALAAALTEKLLTVDPRFMRNLRVKSGKYNQQVSDKCLLIEVGHNGNTLEQAKNSMIWLAKAIAELGGTA